MGIVWPVVVDRPLDSGVAGKRLAGYDAPRIPPAEGKIMDFWARLD